MMDWWPIIAAYTLALACMLPLWDIYVRQPRKRRLEQQWRGDTTMTVIPQSYKDAWNDATNAQTPQEFMNVSRQKGATTINEAVLAYIADWPFDEKLTEDEATIIYDKLVTYLGMTEGDEWS